MSEREIGVRDPNVGECEDGAREVEEKAKEKREGEGERGLVAAEKVTHHSDLRPNFLACFCIMHRVQ